MTNPSGPSETRAAHRWRRRHPPGAGPGTPARRRPSRGADRVAPREVSGPDSRPVARTEPTRVVGNSPKRPPVSLRSAAVAVGLVIIAVPVGWLCVEMARHAPAGKLPLLLAIFAGAAVGALAGLAGSRHH